MRPSDPPGTDDHVRTVVCSALGGLEMVEARFNTHAFPLHAHDEYVIGCVVDGAKATRHGRRDRVVGAGCLTLFNPYDEHASTGIDGTWRFIALYPSAALLRTWLGAGRGGSAPRFSSSVVDDARGAGLIQALLKTLSGSVSTLGAQSAFVESMSYFAERHMSAAPLTGNAAPAQARACLDADLAADVSLSELAALEGVPPITLLRGFRRAYGCTPRVYRTARRVAAAKRALNAGTPIAMIAADLGFCDQAHFTRVFQRWTGGTPGAFARAS